jgi:hypothetical protein
LKTAPTALKKFDRADTQTFSTESAKTELMHRSKQHLHFNHVVGNQEKLAANRQPNSVGVFRLITSSNAGRRCGGQRPRAELGRLGLERQEQACPGYPGSITQ